MTVRQTKQDVMSAFLPENNRRRVALLDKARQRGLSCEERVELDILTERLRAAQLKETMNREREHTMTQQYSIDLDHIFTCHPTAPKQLERYQAIRAAAKSFAQVVLDNTPASADQVAAIRKIREAVMTANAAIALEIS